MSVAIKPDLNMNLFKSAHSALQWAFTVASIPIVKQPSINKMFGKPPRPTENDLLIGLTREEACKQAQNIIGMVNRLDDVAMKQYLFAQYGRKMDARSIDAVMMRVLSSLGSGVTRRRGISKIVLKYLGCDIGVREIRDSLQCNRNDVYKYEQMVYGVLDTIHNNALSRLEEEMREKGLC